MSAARAWVSPLFAKKVTKVFMTWSKQKRKAVWRLIPIAPHPFRRKSELSAKYCRKINALHQDSHGTETMNFLDIDKRVPCCYKTNDRSIKSYAIRSNFDSLSGNHLVGNSLGKFTIANPANLTRKKNEAWPSGPILAQILKHDPTLRGLISLGAEMSSPALLFCFQAHGPCTRNSKPIMHAHAMFDKTMPGSQSGMHVPGSYSPGISNLRCIVWLCLWR